MNKVYKKYHSCIPSLNMTGATILGRISFHWKPENSLAVVVASTLGCAISEQVKGTQLSSLLHKARQDDGVMMVADWATYHDMVEPGRNDSI